MRVGVCTSPAFSLFSKHPPGVYVTDRHEKTRTLSSKNLPRTQKGSHHHPPSHPKPIPSSLKDSPGNPASKPGPYISSNLNGHLQAHTRTPSNDINNSINNNTGVRRDSYGAALLLPMLAIWTDACRYAFDRSGRPRGRPDFNYMTMPIFPSQAIRFVFPSSLLLL